MFNPVKGLPASIISAVGNFVAVGNYVAAGNFVAVLV
jgi:hypothetical protein